MGRRQAEAWHCCEIPMDFRFSLGIFGRCLGSSWRVPVRLEEAGSDSFYCCPCSRPLESMVIFFFSFVFKNQKSYPRGHLSFLAHPVLVFGISNGMLQSSGPVLQMSRARTCGDDSFQVCMCHLIGPTCLVSGQMLLLLAYIPMLLCTAHHML